jgi:uncharacterized protein (DUF362 family)/NAD-dependent dihydropyrimidine dehydrogenase PreA subunit
MDQRRTSNIKRQTSNSVLPIPVSITRCLDYDPGRVGNALRECLEPLGGMSSFVSSGDRVLLKPNLLMGKPPNSGVCTHPEMVRAVAQEVLEAGGIPYLGDSPAVESLAGVLKRSGNMEVVKALGIRLAPFRTPIKIPVPVGGIHRFVLVAREALGFDLTINLPKFKTHGMMTLTLAVKNMFGTVVGLSKAGRHLQAAEHARFADFLLDVRSAIPPRLNILDGITAMEGNGPGFGHPLDLNVVMASTSALAVDQVAGEIAGVAPDRHPVLRRAQERGERGSQPGHVAVIGGKVGDFSRNFILPSTITKVEFKLPGKLDRGLRKSLNTYPVIKKTRCTSCGRCEVICPAGAIVLHEKREGGGKINRGTCINCYCCQEVCPEGAIDMAPGGLLRLLKKFGAA